MQHSAGILFYKIENDIINVLLVHPSGNYNAKAPWSIPKGLVEKDETEKDAAVREVYEEIGITCYSNDINFLADVIYSNKKKIVYCFSGHLPENQVPKVNSWEIDKVEWFPIDKAEQMIHKDQIKFINRLQEIFNRVEDYLYREIGK